MDQTPTDIVIRKSPLWVKLLLGASLVLNLLLVGMMGGLVSRMGGSDGFVLRAAWQALPDDDRRALRREAGDHWRAMRGPGGPGNVHAQMIEALLAPEFDAQAFAAALRAPHDAIAENSLRMQEKLVARVSAMTPDQRRAYADALRDRADRRGPGWRRERPGG